MKEEGRTEEKNGAERAGCLGWGGEMVLKGGKVSSSQSSPEAEGKMSHSVNSHLCFLLPVPGYEEDMETVSSIFVCFFLPTTYSHSHDLPSRPLSLPPLSNGLSRV
jgi:hypothetical protein